MKVFELHGEAACFGLTGDVNGNIIASPQAEGIIDSDVYWVDDTQWPFSTRKDLNGNGGRYALGRGTGAPNTFDELRVPIRSLNGRAKEGWIRVAHSGRSVNGWYCRVTICGIQNNGFLRQHIQFVSADTGDFLLGPGSVGLDATAPGHSGVDNQFTVFEIHFRIAEATDSPPGFVRIYKDFNYQTAHMEFTGDTWDAFAATEEAEAVLFYRDRVDCVIDDSKMQDASVSSPDGQEPWTPDNIADFNRDTAPGELCKFYSVASASNSAVEIFVNQNPLSGPSNMVIDGLGLFGVSGAVTPGNNQFSIDQLPDGGGGSGGASTSTDDIAQNIADAINHASNHFIDPNGRYGMTATALTGPSRVRIELDVLGATGNGAPLVNNFPAPDLTDTGNFGVGGGTSGLDGTFRGQGTIWSARRSAQGYLGFWMVLHLLEDENTNPWDARTQDPYIDVYVVANDGVKDGMMWLTNDAIDAESGFCGDGYFHEAMVPVGTGAFGVNLTRGGVDQGNNWAQVDDGLQDTADASYNFSDTGNVIDSYSYSNFPVPDAQIESILGLSIFSRVQKVSEAADYFSAVGQSGALLFGAPAFAVTDVLGSAWSVHVQSVELEPENLNPWTQVTLNAAEWGANFIVGGA
jgi:hypothetical protein